MFTGRSYQCCLYFSAQSCRTSPGKSLRTRMKAFMNKCGSLCWTEQVAVGLREPGWGLSLGGWRKPPRAAGPEPATAPSLWLPGLARVLGYDGPRLDSTVQTSVHLFSVYSSLMGSLSRTPSHGVKCRELIPMTDKLFTIAPCSKLPRMTFPLITAGEDC